MDFNNWLTKNLGRGDRKDNALIPYPPHSIYGQCVTTASSWSMAQGGPELFGVGDNRTAWLISQNFRHSFFQVIPRNLGVALQEGDILFYRPNDPLAGTGDAGHVDIFVKMIGAATFQGADMDWNGSPILKLVTHNINSVAVIFRPAGGKLMDEYDTKEAYRLILHREPENDSVWQAWVGKKFGDMANFFGASDEWRTQNDVLKVKYPAALDQIKQLTGKQPSVVVNGVTYKPQS